MGDENQKKVEAEPLAQPSEQSVKNEPTPERAREEKQKQEDEACRKGS